MTGTATPAGSEPVRRSQPPKWRMRTNAVGSAVRGRAISVPSQPCVGGQTLTGSAYEVPESRQDETDSKCAVPPSAKRSTPVAEGSG